MHLSRPAHSALILLAIVAAGCAPGPTPTLTVLLPAVTSAPSATPSPAPTGTATPVRTPPALPAAYHTALLNPKDEPQAYIGEACQYLRDKWNPANAVPGTVVMTVMFHSVTMDEVSQDNQITFTQFNELMEGLKAKGFEAINAAQLADFLEHNASIPPRSVLLVADDRHQAAYFEPLFRSYYEKYGWPVVNAWISTPESTAQLWPENVDLEKAFHRR